MAPRLTALPYPRPTPEPQPQFAARPQRDEQIQLWQRESVKRYGVIKLSDHRYGLCFLWPEAKVLLPKTVFPLLIEHLGAGLYEEVGAFFIASVAVINSQDYSLRTARTF